MIRAAVFGGQITAAGADGPGRHANREAPAEPLTVTGGMEGRAGGTACRSPRRRCGERIAGTGIGTTPPERMEQTLALEATVIPDTLWRDLHAAARVDAASPPRRPTPAWRGQRVVPRPRYVTSSAASGTVISWKPTRS